MPTHPCENYLRVLQGKFIQSVACGNDRIFCITQGSTVGKHIGAALLHKSSLFSLSNKIADSDEEIESVEVSASIIIQ